MSLPRDSFGVLVLNGSACVLIRAGLRVESEPRFLSRGNKRSSPPAASFLFKETIGPRMRGAFVAVPADSGGETHQKKMQRHPK